MSYYLPLLPALFQDKRLFELETSTGLPLRLALLGLAGCADKAGRFYWKPTALQQRALPYDSLPFEKMMNMLVDKGFLLRYLYQGLWYGAIAAPAYKRRWESQRLVSPLSLT